MNDSLQNIIIVPQFVAADTLKALDTDLEHALESSRDYSSTDLSALRIEVPPPAPSWRDGIEGTPRNLSVGDNPGVLAMITGMFLLMLLSYRHCRQLFSTLFGELLGMRRRANVFDEPTSNENQMMILMALQWSVYTGLLLYAFLSSQVVLTYDRALVDTLSLVGLMGCYYLFQICAYWVVGFTFSSSSGRRYFVQGFTSSQSLLGFCLIIPALVAIFYPEAADLMLKIGAFLYLAARIVFIVKGFRIFYHKIYSIVYFILYLCTLEIIPLLFLYKIALLLVSHQW